MHYNPSNLPHIYWADLENNGIMHEIAVIKQDKSNGDIYFIRIDQLDAIDRGRLRKIVLGRSATTFELWDLMSSITLNNGVNALEYFHQLVKVRTSSGQIVPPSSSIRGAGPRRVIPQQPAAATAPTTKIAEDAAPISEAADDGVLPTRLGDVEPKKPARKKKKVAKKKKVVAAAPAD